MGFHQTSTEPILRIFKDKKQKHQKCQEHAQQNASDSSEEDDSDSESEPDEDRFMEFDSDDENKAIRLDDDMAMVDEIIDA